MRSVTIHALLLVVALGAAAATWTASSRQFGDATAIVVWDHDTDDLLSLQYRDESGQVTVERRGQVPDAYLWGMQTFPAPPTGPVTGLEDPSARPMTQDEYPIGDAGENVVETLSHLRALRDLGSADADTREEYGLTDSLPVLQMRFADGAERTLIFGAPVVGGGVRYVLDVDGNHVYAVSSDLVTPFEQGAGSMRLTNLHRFELEEVGSVTLRNAAGVERTRERLQVPGVPPRTYWVTPGASTSNEADAVFAAVVDELKGMYVVGRYLGDLKPEDLDLVVRADYKDERGRDLGWAEVFKAKDSNPARYYLRTERTVVPAEMYDQNGLLMERDVANLFRSADGAGSRSQ